MAYKNYKDQLAANKRHYHANKAYYKRKAVKRRQEKRDAFAKIKESMPCTDCGKYYPACVMDFDHVKGTKKFSISRILDWSPAKLNKELSKCEIVCANCHRIRTYIGSVV